MPLVSARKVNYGRIDPALSRELFIRHALVEGDWETHHAFFAENRELLEEVEELEHRARRRDILVDDETLFDFYDERDPGRRRVRPALRQLVEEGPPRRSPTCSPSTRDLLVNEGAGRVSERDYPDAWAGRRCTLPLTYQFEPGAGADGVTVAHPAADARPGRRTPTSTWQVPGLREELVTALIRSLPKALRRNFVPAPDTPATRSPRSSRARSRCSTRWSASCAG